MYQQWLIAHDFDDGSDAAATAAAQLADSLARTTGVKGRLVLCHVVSPVLPVISPDLLGIPDISASLAATSEASGRRLRATAEALGARFPTLQIETRLCWGPTVATIVDEAERQHVDAIAVGSHGRKGLAWAFLGSVAESAVHKSRKPVLVVKLDEPPAGIAATA